MNKSLRKAVIAGNWKMNKTPAETTALINEIKPLVADADCDVVCCVPYVDLFAALEAAKGGVDSMYGQATSAYNSDHLYGNQGIADAAGTIASAVDTNASSERMNDATNKTNLQVAKTHTKQTIYNKK